MTFKKTGTLILALCFAGSLFAGTASASPPAATVVTETQEEILWTTATVEQAGVDSLEVRIMAPKVRGKKRAVFQRCIFNFQGMGDYRCGIDVAEGSAASKRNGTWVTKVLVNGLVADRTGFSL